jgi:hypothetical protein
MGKRRKGRKTRERVEGVALLSAFLDRNNISYRLAAEQLGVEHPTVWQWTHGITIPLDKYRAAIAVWTSGEVPEAAWLKKSERDPIEIQPFRANGTDGH